MDDHVVTRTYVELPEDTVVHAVRRVYEEDDDIISLRFGDEGLVLEIELGLVPQLVEALEEAARSA